MEPVDSWLIFSMDFLEISLLQKQETYSFPKINPGSFKILQKKYIGRDLSIWKKSLANSSKTLDKVENDVRNLH